jgi:hypothetical protein
VIAGPMRPEQWQLIGDRLREASGNPGLTVEDAPALRRFGLYVTSDEQVCCTPLF